MVAVRNSGRVRMHKGRENSNGTFSIGKTWNLDDLSKIQSFSHLNPQNDEEAQYKAWAGDRGFTVTLVKPYYWQAATAKEKDFFILSLVKIFKKYTQGQFPELVGFSGEEVDTLVGSPALRVGGRSESQRPGPLSPPTDPRTLRDTSGSRSPEPGSRDARGGLSARNRPPTSQSDRSLPMSRNPSSQGQPFSPPVPPAIEALRSTRAQQGSPDRGLGLRQVPSREPIPSLSATANSRPPSSRDQPGAIDRPFGLSSSIDSQRLTPQSSRSEMNPIRPESSGTTTSSKFSSLRPNDDSPPRQRQQSFDEQSQPAPNGLGITSSQVNQWKTNGAQRTASPFSQRQQKRPSFSSTSSLRGATESSADEANLEQMPGRKPPPLSKPSQRDADNIPDVPTPRAGSFPSDTARGQAKETSRDALKPLGAPGAAAPASDPADGLERNGLFAPPSQRRTPSPMTAESADDTSDATQEPADRSETPQKDEEEHRPGLGPMIKNKAAKVAAANTLRKAANAYGAFKPRAGGAGEKFRLLKEQGKTKSDEPDGITSVVPAPGLLRKGQPDGAPKSPISPVSPVAQNTGRTSEELSKLSFEQKREEVPEVKIISPTSEGPSPATTRPPLPLPPRPATPEEIEAESQEVQKARQRKRRSDQQIKYLSALGIETSILDGRGLEFESILSDFGWGGDAPNKKIDLLEVEVKKELGRVEAGSWLMSGAGERDERVEQVEKMLDRAIRECEELDTLLTLYSVELSVSGCCDNGQGRADLKYRVLTTISRSSKLNHKVFKYKLQIKNCCKPSYRTWLKPFLLRLSSSSRLGEEL